MRSFASVRARLLGLGLLAVIPLIALFGWNAWQVREQAIAGAKDELSRGARFLAEDIANDVRAAHQLLHALGAHPDVRAGRQPGCSAILRAQKAQAPLYTDFFLFDGATGLPLCHSVAGMPPARPATDRDYFVQALATRKPVVGRPITSRADGKSVLPIALPLAGETGAVERVLATGFDLARLGERKAMAHAVAGAAFTVWQADGTIIYRYPENEKWAGQRLTDLELAQRIRTAGARETRGADGIMRVYGFAALEDFPAAGIYISLGVARDELTAKANSVFIRSLSGLAFIAAAVLALGWLVAERYLSRPLAALDQAQQRLAGGDLAVRAPAEGAEGEVGRLLRGFNKTAAALQRAERAMRVLSEANRALLRADSEQALLDTVCRIAVQTGGYRIAYFGYAERDEARSVRLAAAHGASPEFIAEIRATWGDAESGRGPTGSAIRTGRLSLMRDMRKEHAGAPWREAALREGLGSALAAPVRVKGEVAGALTIYAAERDAFDEREVELLSELADDLGFGIETLRLREAHAAAEREIRALNADLERRVAERTAELATVNRESADLYNNAPCGYHSVDENGLIVRMNDTWLRWLGYRREEVVGKMRHPDLMTPESAERFWKEAFPLFKRQGWLKEVEFEYMRRDGSTFPASLQTSTVYDERGRYVMSRTTVFDITERKRAEAEIARKNAELARANEMKSQFLATMSHELRTPLNAIIGFAEVLKDGLAGSLNDEQKSFAADIHASGRHLLSLINDILDLSKVEAGMMTLELEPVGLAPLLQGGLTMVKEKAMKQRLALELEVEPGLPAFAADARKLKQIVFNLLSNAVKFTPDGGRVRISARRVPRAGVALPAGRPGRMDPPPAGGNGEFVEIAVSDSGIGVAEADLEHLFQPFVQIDSALGRRQQGTGLGLALIKRLAELHGGAAGVSSAPGRGSTFLVWLPLVEARPQPAAAPVAVPEKQIQTAEPLALIVEDDDAAAQMIERALRGEGFRCQRAATAEEALVRAAKERPDLITLDIFLPHMDGWDFMARLKAERALASVPVVIMSVAPNLEHGIALGARRVLQKPFSRDELRAALAGIVPTAAEGAARTVLIVDDNRQAVDLLAGYLNGSSYRLLRAYGGREAIEAASRARPDLILLDLVMPDVSGFDVVQQLKTDPQTARIPIVIVTAKDLTAEDRSVLSGSVQRILAKAALRNEDFITEVRRALRGTQSEA